jgi:hypothetical protein
MERFSGDAANECAAKLPKTVSATIIDLPERQEPKIDRRTLRSSPLREKIGPISFAVSIVGKMCTADLREEPLDIETSRQEGWIQILQAAARLVADGLDKAAERLVMTPEEFGAAYAQASSEIQQIISDKIRAFKAEPEISHSPLNLPVSGLGQPVLDLVVEHDQ